MSIIEVLEAAKLDYQNRTERSQFSLCHYLHNEIQTDVEYRLKITIPSFCGNNVWYKGIKPCSQPLGYKNSLPPKETEAHYAARLELIDILITHFKNL